MCACVCLYTENGATYNSSICSDKGPTLETPALKLFTEANLCLPTKLYPIILSHQHSTTSFFNFKLNPFIYNQLNCIYAKKCSLIERVKVVVLTLSCFYQENPVQSTQNLTIGLVSTPTNTSTIFDEVWMRWSYCFDDPFDTCSYSKQKIYLLLMLW